MPLQATSGAASYDAFGGGAAAVPTYIEDVFSTYLYAGTDANQAINNGVDLSGKGGMLWLKARNQNTPTVVFDTNRGASPTNSQMLWTAAPDYSFPTSSNALNSFNSNGFTLGADDTNWVNYTGVNFASWSFRKQPKFFDVVTYSGNSTAGREIAHNLGSTPGCIIVKRLNQDEDWIVYHKGISNSLLRLNTTDANASANAKYYWGNNTTFIAPTSTVFTVATDSSINQTGGTYVAYIFAHDAGGFGLTGTDNVISCGSFTTDGSGYIPTVNLGYEPQWVLAKPSNGTGNWFIMDNMRGWYNQQADQGNALFPNTSGAEAVGYNAMIPTATGFTGPAVNFGAGITYIYIAIRRGPMKVPTSGTSVFNNIARTGTGVAATITGVGFAPDLVLGADRTGANTGDDCRYFWVDKLRGRSQYLNTAVTAAEVGPSSSTQDVTAFGMDGISVGTTANAYFNVIADPLIHHYFKRAPSFFDEVCYTGNSTGSTAITHNLGVVPELIIVKSRSAARNWPIYIGSKGNNGNSYINRTDAWASGSDMFANTTPTASEFYVGNNLITNNSGETYVSYLFATCAGVSKVGSYTGTATTKQIDCGFTSGARFVLIKRTDSTGDWYVWDSARGIVAGNDPYLLLNAYAPAENTSTDYVDTYSAGFEISSTAPSAINASGGTFIFLAIA